MKKLIILASLVLPLGAQQNATTYTALYEATLSAAAGASTLQQQTSPYKTASLIGVQVYCSVACTWTFESTSGASGSSTNGVPTSPGQTAVSSALHYSGSNASAGTVINKVVYSGADTKTLNFLDALNKSNSVIGRTAGQGFTVRFTSMTGDVKVTWLWREE